MKSGTPLRYLVLGFMASVAFVSACWSTRQNPLYCDGGQYQCTDPMRPYCDLVTNECEATPPDGFMTDMEAPDLAPMCASNASCTSTTSPICDGTSKSCRGCMTGECAAFSGKPVCASSGACVECAAIADCAAAGKTCDIATNVCIACKANSECTSGACRADGVCAQANDIVYVDNKGGTCTGTVHAGTMADPYCQVNDALGAAGSTILVAASSADYNAIAVSTALDKHIVGPGRDATLSNTAHFFQSTKAAVDLTLTTGTAKLSLAGVMLFGSAGGTPAPGVYCSESPGADAEVTLVRSEIRNSGANAVLSSGCSMVLDANDIHDNAAGGISITGGTYAITNNFIALNGNLGTATIPGFKVDTTATGSFAFNTVAKNQVSAGVGGIDCSVVAHAIDNSIVVQNTPATNTQLTGTCTLTNVVAGTTETAAAAIKLDPAFVSAADFRLDMTAGAAQTANEACCVDKIATSTNTHDVDFTPRPQHGQWDIGAFEAP